MVQGLGESSRVLKKLLSGCREGLQAEALSPEGLLKGCWASEATSHAGGEPVEEILALPRLGTSQPVKVGQVAAHFLDEFHLLV